MENKTVEMVVKDLLLADNRKKKKNCLASLLSKEARRDVP